MFIYAVKSFEQNVLPTTQVDIYID